MTEDTTKYVDEEYLLSHGFERYNEEQSGEICDMPFMNEEDMHFREKEFDRNMFVLILSEGIPMDHGIWVQYNAGCGFVRIPELWSGLPVKFFESIYYGIRGCYPKVTPVNTDK
jgi:hypothetical protein